MIIAQFINSPHYSFLTKLALAMLGTLITYQYPDIVHSYWLVALALYAGLAVFPQYYQTRDLQAVFKPLLPWLAAMGPALYVYLLYSDGRLMHEDAGLIIILLLAQGNYLQATHSKTWQDYFLAGYLALLSLVVPFIDAHPAFFMVLGIVAGWYSYAQKPITQTSAA